MDSIRTTRRTSNEVIKKNAEIISKLHHDIDKLNYNINRLNDISKDFEKIKNKDLDYFLGLHDNESYMRPKPYVKFP